MNQDTLFKCKNGILGRSVKFILLNGVRGILSCELTLQFHRNHRDAIHKKHDVNTVLIKDGIMQLSGTMKYVCLILIDSSLIQSGFRLPKYRIERNASVSKSFTKHS